MHLIRPLLALATVAFLNAPLLAATTERISVSYRLGFNLSTEFTDNVGFPSAASIGAPTGGGVDRTYDDGYNRVDASGNAGGLTWNWGYQNASQAPGNDTVLLSSTAINPAPLSRAQDEPQHGVELGYYRECGVIGSLRWGIEAAAGWMRLEFTDASPLTAATTRTVDAYSLGGAVPPVAPYAGTFAGPGVLLGDAPSRSVSAGTATISGLRELDAHFFSARIGPALEIPLATNLTLTLGGGFAVAYVEGDLSYSETATLAGVQPWTRSGAGSRNDTVLGYYLTGGVAWRFAPQWSLVASGQFVDTQDYHVSGGDRTAVVRLGRGIFVNVGLGFSF